jgi:choline dehydrogenase
MGRRPGHGDVGLRPLPALLQAHGDLPRRSDDEFRGDDGPLVLERGPATNPLFDAFFDAAVQAGYPRTDDVNGYRQEGFARSTATSTGVVASAPPAPTCTR